jgi:hypothetical protein
LSKFSIDKWFLSVVRTESQEMCVPEVTFALVVVLGLVGMVAVQVFGSEHEAEAKGCNNSIAFNTSKGRCFHTWLGEEVP